MTPEMKIPVMPFFINGHIPPLPKAQRCYELGRAVGRAIETWPTTLRVVIDGQRQLLARSLADRAWRPAAPTACPIRTGRSGYQVSRRQQVRKLINEATQAQMLKAGNVGGELLNWIAMLGAIGDRKPQFVRRRWRMAMPTRPGAGANHVDLFREPLVP